MNNSSGTGPVKESRVSVIWAKLTKIEELVARGIGKADEIGTILHGTAVPPKGAGEEIGKGAGFLEDVGRKENDILGKLEELIGLLCSIKNGM